MYKQDNNIDVCENNNS